MTQAVATTKVNGQRLWFEDSGGDGPPVVLYEYQQRRAGEHPKAFLAGFRGYLHVDGYAGYHGRERHLGGLLGARAQSLP